MFIINIQHSYFTYKDVVHVTAAAPPSGESIQTSKHRIAVSFREAGVT